MSKAKYVRSHYLVVVVPLVLDVLPLIEATAEPRSLLNLFYLGAVAHVAIVSPDKKEVSIAFWVHDNAKAFKQSEPCQLS